MSDQNSEFLEIKEWTQSITGSSYVVGFGFAVAAILKFKAHKDHPGSDELELGQSDSEELLNIWWSLLSENQQAELTNRGLTMQSLIEEIENSSSGDISSVLNFLEGLKSIDLS